MIKQIFGSTKDFITAILAVSSVGSIALFILAKEAVLFITPIIVYVLGGLIILLIGIVAFILFADQIEAYLTRHTERKRDRALARNEATKSDLSLNRERYYIDFERVLMAGQVRQIMDGLIYGSELGEAKFQAHTKAIAQMNDVPLLSEPMKPLLPELVRAERALFTGGMKSGKTTNLLWLAHERLRFGRVLVIDSHTTPAKWPRGCEVIGAGRDYRRIEATLEWLMKEMDRRFSLMAQGKLREREPDIVTIISDEWTLLPQVIRDVKRFMIPLLTESRKAGLDFFLAAHDTTVEALGIKGVSGLKAAFDLVIFCKRDQSTGQHQTMVSFDGIREREARPYEPPGPFIIEHSGVNQVPILGEPIGDVWDYSRAEDKALEQEPTPREKIILDLFDEGASFNQISKTINEGRTGGTYNDEIRGVLRKFNKLEV